MAVTYRPIKEEEQAEAMRLWTTVFKIPADFFQSELDGEENIQLHQTLVAHDGEKIVSSVQYFIRNTRAQDGVVEKMGGIGSVSTLEEARKQGHSGKLLQLAIEWMQKDGCRWSKLFSGINSHYERYGWKVVETRYREGKVGPEMPLHPDWNVVPVNPSSDEAALERIMAIYDAYNAQRVLTHVRSKKHWRSALVPRMMWDNGVTYTAYLGECRKPGAYVVCKTRESTLYIQEAGYMPGCEEALMAILPVIQQLAVHREATLIRAHLPFDPTINEALNRLTIGLETGKYQYVMIRPLVDGLSMDEIEKPFHMDGSHFWPLDDF